MESIYEKISSYDGDDFEEFLKKINAYQCFHEVLTYFKAVGHAEAIVKYIVNCYSTESEFVSRGATWAGIKENVAKYVQLPEQLHGQIVHLGIYLKKKAIDTEDEKEIAKQREWDMQMHAVVNSIYDYMTFEGDRDNRILKKLYDLYEEQMAGMSDPDNDYEDKDKCRKRASETRKEIEEIEQGMKNKQTNALKEGMKELKKMPTALRPEIAARK